MIPLEEQQAIIGRHLTVAFDELIQRLHAHRSFIYGLALERLTAGYDEYGDATFQRPHSQLEREIREELADALNYVAILIDRQGAE